MTFRNESVSTEAYSDFGRLALRGSPSAAATDLALIEVHPAFHDVVRASVKGHPRAPAGVASAETTEAGDLVVISGYGSLYSGAASAREQRRGLLHELTEQTHVLQGPTTHGDSGGPLFHEASGNALGVVSRACGQMLLCETGPTVEGILAFAGAKGLPLALRRA